MSDQGLYIVAGIGVLLYLGVFDGVFGDAPATAAIGADTANNIVPIASKRSRVTGQGPNASLYPTKAAPPTISEPFAVETGETGCYTVSSPNGPMKVCSA
jgi:hypothetical protein